MKILLPIIYTLFLVPSISQDTLVQKQITVVYLKNGSILKGILAKGKIENSFELELREGITMQLPFSEVKKFIQVEGKARQPIEYLFREKGLYNITSVKTNSGYNTEDEFTLGYGLESVTGYMINRYIGLGLGFGYDFYGYESYKSLYPLFLETRGYFYGQKNAYYYSLAGGYSFGSSNSESNITSGRASWMWHPALGIRLGAKKNFNFTMDIGLRIQKAKWYYEPSDSFIKSEEYSYLYKRFVIRLGLQI